MMGMDNSSKLMSGVSGATEYVTKVAREPSDLLWGTVALQYKLCGVLDNAISYPKLTTHS